MARVGVVHPLSGVVLMHDRIPPAAVETILDDLVGKPDFQVVGLDTLMKTKVEACAGTGG